MKCNGKCGNKCITQVTEQIASTTRTSQLHQMHASALPEAPGIVAQQNVVGIVGVSLVAPIRGEDTGINPTCNFVKIKVGYVMYDKHVDARTLPCRLRQVGLAPTQRVIYTRACNVMHPRRHHTRVADRQLKGNLTHTPHQVLRVQN